MPALYSKAPEVEKIASDLIEVVEDHQPLDDVTMLYVWRDQAGRSGGRKVLGRARKLTGLNAYLATGSNAALFVIEIAADIWEGLEPYQRRALVDHELCHCKVSYNDHGEQKLSIRAHDLEEFGGVIDRHGLWLADVQTFGGKVAEQMSLLDEVTTFVEGTETADEGRAISPPGGQGGVDGEHGSEDV